MVCWLLGRWGCLAAWVICWVFSRWRHAVWCLHPVVCAVAFCCMLCDVTCTPVFAAIPREGGGGLVSSYYFCSSGVRGDCSSSVLATLQSVARSPLERFPKTPLEQKCLMLTSPPPLPWNGSKYRCTHRCDITEHTTECHSTHHGVQTPHSMPQPAKHPTNNPSCQTTPPAKQPTHHSTNPTNHTT